MKKILSLLLIIFYCLFAQSQSLPCGGGRFFNRVFSATTVDSAILFGHNTTFEGMPKDLLMDVYQPAGDSAAIRPLIIFGFGGSFTDGDRTQLEPLCDSMALKGYVTAAIDYRLYDNPLGIYGFAFSPDDALDAVAKAMSDFKAAIRYFKRDAATSKTYRIDTNSIIIGGISSGSISALHTAYINTLSETVPPMSTAIINNGGMEGNTDIPGAPLIGTYTYAGIRGVWNMSGALLDSAYIKTGDPALFGVHGTADAIVPYGYGRIFGAGQFVSGSSSLNNQAIKVGVPTSFISVPGGDHDTFYFNPAIAANILATASTFFGNILCPNVLSVSGATLNANIVSGHVALSWQTLSENDSKGFAVEKLLPSGWTILGEVNSKSVNGFSSLPLNYSFDDVQPQNGINLYRLKIISLNGDIVYSNTYRVSWNNDLGRSFVIYPNPASDILHYKTNSSNANTLKIYSADMRLVQTTILPSAAAVSISRLPDGLYFGVLSDSKNKQIGSSWFIKR